MDAAGLMILDHCEVTNTTARSWIVVEIAEIHYAAPGAWPVGLREDHRALMLEETGLAVEVLAPLTVQRGGRRSGPSGRTRRTKR